MSKVLRHYTAEELEDKLLSAAEDLRALRGRLPLLATDAAIFDSQYRQQKAQTFFISEKTLTERGVKVTDGSKNYLVDEICTEKREQAHVATNLFKSYVQVAKSLETEITVYQSLLRRQEKEMAFANIEDRSGRIQPTVSVLRQAYEEPKDFETSFDETVSVDKDPWDDK